MAIAKKTAGKTAKKTVKTSICKATSTAFEKLLKRDNSAIKADRAKRIGKSAANAQRALVMNLEQEVMNLEDSLETMTDLSTDNQSTTMNRIEDFNAESFVQRYHSAHVKLAVKREELEIAIAIEASMFS